MSTRPRACSAAPLSSTRSALTARLGRVVALALVALALVACQEDYKNDDAVGGYMIFRKALLAGDADGVWASLDSNTHKIFDEQVVQLKTMSEQIDRFLPLVDQKLARKQTGVVLLKEHNIQTGQDLFKFTFKPDKLTVTPEIKVGSEVSDVQYNDANTEAAIVTYGGQEYRLVQEDGQWRVASWNELITERLKWVNSNTDALNKTVEDLAKEEREQVDKVISYLLAEDKKRRKR